MADFEKIDSFRFPILELIQCNIDLDESQSCDKKSIACSTDNLLDFEPEFKIHRKSNSDLDSFRIPSSTSISA